MHLRAERGLSPVAVVTGIVVWKVFGETDPHQFVYLTKHVGSQWCSGKHVCQGANPGDLGGNVRAAIQKIWQHTELPFKIPHVKVLVIQVVNFRRVCTGFEFRITKDGTQQYQFICYFIVGNKTDIQVDVDGLK